VPETQSDVVVESINALRSVLDWQSTLPTDWLTWFHVNKIVLTGVGKSFDVARLGASLLQTVGKPALAIHATDLLHGGFGLLTPGCTSTLVLLSNSGRTREVLDVADYVRQLRVHGRIIRTVAITRYVGPNNELAQRTDHILSYRADFDGSRHGTIPSVSTTAQLAWLNVIACVEADVQSAETLALSHPAGHLAVVYERMPSD
jgi:D-arabinose 5-phosphate isomerase GutQ